MASDPDHFEQHQPAPIVIAASAALSPEVRVAPVDVDRVDDVTGAGAIDQVAERAAEDQRQPVARQLLVLSELPRVERDGDQRQRRIPIATADLGSRRRWTVERGAGVLHVRRVEKIGNDDLRNRAAAWRGPRLVN